MNKAIIAVVVVCLAQELAARRPITRPRPRDPCRRANGNPINEGQPVPTSNPCEVNCFCSNGERICAVYSCRPPPRPDCEPEYIKGQCCPSYDHCETVPDECNVVQCIVAPCDGKTCPRYPDAECRDNYCGGCNYDFYLNDNKVDC